MEESKLIPLELNYKEIHKRLEVIFPEGTEQRANLIAENTAKTVFVMLYVNAIEGTTSRIRPSQVTGMTDIQAEKKSNEARVLWSQNSLKSGFFNNNPNAWYADNTRESIRDEALIGGLINIGAAKIKEGIPKTSSKPRYYLREPFANLFTKEINKVAIEEWRSTHLAPGHLGRIKILSQKQISLENNKPITVKFPNGESRNMSPGPSSLLSKAVIESFAIKFLKRPAVLLLSESGNKLIQQDDSLLKSIKLNIDVSGVLPDIILADIDKSPFILIFVEVVATDGPISKSRKKALLKIATNAGFDSQDVFFMTAYSDKNTAVFRKTFRNIAWGTLAWFEAEPNNLLVLSDTNNFDLSKIQFLNSG